MCCLFVMVARSVSTIMSLEAGFPAERPAVSFKVDRLHVLFCIREAYQKHYQTLSRTYH